MKTKGSYALMLVTMLLGGTVGCMCLDDDTLSASTPSAAGRSDGEELGQTEQALTDPAQPPPPPPDGGTDDGGKKPPPPPPPPRFE